MLKKILASFLLFIFAVTPVLAARPGFSVGNITDPGRSILSKDLELPAPAGNSSVINLGFSVDPQTGKIVEGLAFITPKKQHHHRSNHTKGPSGGGNTTNNCFSFTSKGAKWKNVEGYIVDPTNVTNLSDNFVKDIVRDAVTKWEDASDGFVDGVVSNDIIGNEIDGFVDGVDLISPDGKNEVLFGDVSSSGSIAVTIVWGIFRGPPSGRELVEWDQMYDDVDFDWSDSGEAGKMDFENIVTHEHGHIFGLTHPDDSCTEETMYRFASDGETKKRDLNAGDITGISDLY